MVFENLTLVELHVNEPEELPKPDRKAGRKSEPETETGRFGSTVKKALALVAVSIVFSILVSVAVKRVVSKFKKGEEEGERETEDEEETVVEIGE